MRKLFFLFKVGEDVAEWGGILNQGFGFGQAWETSDITANWQLAIRKPALWLRRAKVAIGTRVSMALESP